MPIYLLLARRTEALTVETTVPITSTPPFPKFSAVERSQSLRSRGSSLRNIAWVRCNPRGTVMAATFNPQAAAEQARNAYRNVTAQLGLLALDIAIPEALSAVAEKTVGQTREAYDRSKDALEVSIATFERSFDAAGWGAAVFNHKIIDIAQRNLNSGFDLANSLAGAKNLAEIVELQAAYWRKQFSALTAQAEKVPALSTKVVADAGRTAQGSSDEQQSRKAN
jgi:phasin